MTPEPVAVESRGAVRVIAIDRPEARNAVNPEVARAIAAAIDELEADPSARVAVLTGAGGTFCAGMDLKAFAEGGVAFGGDRGFAGIVERPPEKPIVAAVEGFALAGGFEIALACDLIVASRTATFGIPEVRLGLVAAGGALLRLPRRIPYHVAAELALTGEPVSAQRGYELGFVNRLVDPGGALEAAVTLAETIARNGPAAVAATKTIRARAGDWDRDEQWRRQWEIAHPVLDSEEAEEGARAFAEKREPRWRDA
jgi:enoyl-CoA hydratase